MRRQIIPILKCKIKLFSASLRNSKQTYAGKNIKKHTADNKHTSKSSHIRDIYKIFK